MFLPVSERLAPSLRFKNQTVNDQGNSKNVLYSSVVNSDSYVFGPPKAGSVIICTDPDPSIDKQKSKKNLDIYNFVTVF